MVCVLLGGIIRVASFDYFKWVIRNFAYKTGAISWFFPILVDDSLRYLMFRQDIYEAAVKSSFEVHFREVPFLISAKYFYSRLKGLYLSSESNHY